MPDADITINGQDFVVDKIGRQNTDIVFTININVVGSRGDTPHHEFQIVVQPGGRSDLTDDYLEEQLQQWADTHPDHTIKDFGVEEVRLARIGEPLTRRQ